MNQWKNVYNAIKYYMKGDCNSTEFIDCYKNKDCVFNNKDSLEDIYKK